MNDSPPAAIPAIADPPPREHWLRRLPVKRSAVLLLRYIWLPAILIAFAVYGGRLVPGYRYQTNPDGISYLTVAQQYLHGHWHDALNAYWSPLYSWLLVPFLAAGVEPLLATKILAVIIGIGTLGAVWWIGRNLKWGIESRLLLCVTLMPILMHFGMTVTTPDLLMTCMLLVYLGQMTLPRYHRHGWKSGVASGALAGAAYLAKAYALPVVLGHFVLTNVIAFFRSPDRRVRKRVFVQAAAGLVMLGIIVGAWGMALRHKYGYFTTGSTGTFNIAYNGPAFRMPMHTGLVPVPTESGTSGWDDATVMTYTPWNPLATRADRLRWEQNRTRNERQLIDTSERFTWLLWIILIPGVWLTATPLDRAPRRGGGYIVAALVIFPLGYYLLHVEERFLSFVCVGLLLTGAFVIHALTWPMNRWVRVPLRFVATAGLCWSFVSNPKWNPDKEPWQSSFARWSIASLWNNNADDAHLAERLKGVVPARGKIASIDHWDTALDLSYLLNLRYYGALGAKVSPDEVPAKLKAYQIDYLFFWGAPGKYRFLKGKPDLAAGRAGALHIYDLRDPASATQPTTKP